ncbi:hypothetical protein Mlaev_00656 [Microbacterium laevaniformans]|uniref:Uncharacterized protein n=1 Tax=Microbacterium laevaniformans TaxID=36807 RepID=A0A150HGZ0_9MICO|nr:hypothetical protein [Microbacterium laevaniformans]KXZ61397.1 hypothetical protein Mlaev_00656 [Microbacterium laevaniformans]
MGFKEWIKSEGVHGERRAQAGVNLLTLNATGLLTQQFRLDLKEGVLHYQGDSASVADLGDIEYSPVVPEKRMTATRIVAGGVLLGPVGMVIGAFAKKQTNAAGWLLIDVLDAPAPDGEIRAQWLIEVKKGKTADAMKLVNELRNAKRRAARDANAQVIESADPETPAEAS